MSNKIQLDIVSDVVCPWCIIGYKRLEKAIKELGVEDQVEIQWHPFELNPAMPLEGENLREHLAKKYGTTLQDSIRARENLTQLGAELGFQFDYFDEMRMVNTRDAHMLLQYAHTQGKQAELEMVLFSAFFGQRKNISDRDVLKELVQSVGLDAQQALAQLDNADAIEALQQAEDRWRHMGVNSVPTVVFNMTSALTGAQPVEAYKQVLTELLAQA